MLPSRENLVFLISLFFRQKRIVSYGLLHGGLLLPYGHWQFAYVYGNHALIFCGVYGVDMFFFYLA